MNVCSGSGDGYDAITEVLYALEAPYRAVQLRWSSFRYGESGVSTGASSKLSPYSLTRTNRPLQDLSSSLPRPGLYSKTLKYVSVVRSLQHPHVHMPYYQVQVFEARIEQYSRTGAISARSNAPRWPRPRAADRCSSERDATRLIA